MNVKVADLMARRGGVILTSFPRSGSTLTRKFLSTIFRQRVDPKIAAASPLLLVPNYVGETDETLFERIPIIGRTHSVHLIGSFRTIYVFRRPDDALFSYFNLCGGTVADDDRDRFLANNARHWRTGIGRATALADEKPDDIHLLCYENYLRDPVGEVRDVLRFVGVTPPDDLEAIIAALNAGYRRRMGTETGPLQDQRGVVGASRDFYSPEIRRIIDAKLSPLYERLKEIASERRR